MIIKVINRYTKQTIHSGEFESVKFCVQDGIKKEIDFSHADLQNISLIYGEFKSGNFRGANFQNSTLQFSDFTNCNLINTNLDGCMLLNADFRDANLQHATYNFIEMAKAYR